MNPRIPQWSILKKKKLCKAEPIITDVHINRIHLAKNRLKDISGIAFEIRLKAGMTSVVYGT